MKTFFVFLFFFVNGCSYRFGYGERDLPGGYDKISVPVFKNKTAQVAIESYFTNEMIKQFNRSRVAKVVGAAEGEVTLEGILKSIKYVHGPQIDANIEDENITINLPSNSVLTTEYRVFLEAEIILRRNADKQILWQGAFRNERVYASPQVGFSVINSVNPLYNQSARMEVFQLMAQDMMAEAHDRMTENF